MAKTPAPKYCSNSIYARPVPPFTAIVEQVEMKLALILHVIDPKEGRVMMKKICGTGKISTIRALVDALLGNQSHYAEA